MNKQIEKAIKEFPKTKEFENGVISATIAGYGGGGYSAEFFPDGTTRVLWDNNIGNLYRSPGVIISLPQLDTDDIEPPGTDKNELREAFSWQADDMEKEFLADAFDN